MELPEGQIYFETSNFMLAHALHVAGIPWQDPSRPCVNRYTDDTLAKLGCPTMEHAINAGKRGNVFYYFRNTPGLKAKIAAWDAAVKELEKMAESSSGGTRKTSCASSVFVLKRGCRRLICGRKTRFAERDDDRALGE
jgi:hypothetical protein